MFYIFHDNETETRAKVTVVESAEFADDAAEGILVDDYPRSPEDNGMLPVLYINPTTKEMWFEYDAEQPIPLTVEEELAQLKAELKITQDALDALLLG